MKNFVPSFPSPITQFEDRLRRESRIMVWLMPVLLLGLLLVGCATSLRVFNARERHGEVKVGQQFVVTVPSAVDAAYAWEYQPRAEDNVALHDKWYEPGEPGQGLWFYRYTALRAGDARLHYTCRRVTDPDGMPLANYYFYLTIQP